MLSCIFAKNLLYFRIESPVTPETPVFWGAKLCQAWKPGAIAPLCSVPRPLPALTELSKFLFWIFIDCDTQQSLSDIIFMHKVVFR